MLNSFDLYLANRIQEKGHMDIATLADRFQRSTATVRRSISSLNELLPVTQQFSLVDSVVTSQASYQDLLAMIQSLSIADFSTSFEERCDYLISEAALKQVFNMSEQYDQLLISQSTKKKDRPLLTDLLAEKGLSIQTIRGKGVSITGNPAAFRILATRVLLTVTRIDATGRITERQANDPIQRQIYQKFAPLFEAYSPKKLEDFLISNDIQLNYTSKKFLLLYTFLSEYRISLGQLVTTGQNCPVPYKTFAYFQLPEEDQLFSCLLAGLDNNLPTLYQESPATSALTEELIDFVEGRILTTFYTRQVLLQEVGQYLHKCLIRKYLDFDFYDNKLDDVKKEFSFLYQLVSYFFEVEKNAAPRLTEYQLATITLIFRNHILQNKIAGRNTKQVIVVTNSAKEKSNFFSEQLLYHFDVAVVKELNIHEIHQLKQLQFDHLITFSNRISMVLRDQGYENIKMNYYIHDDDIQLLTKRQFSLNSHRKLLAKDFVQQIQQLPHDQLPAYLAQNFPNFFV